jgi:hypothetical protein
LKIGELEELRVWKHELKAKHPIFFLLCLENFGFGFGGHHRQLSTECSSLFFLFVLLLLRVGGCHHQVSVESPAPSFSFFFFVFCCLWVQVGSIINFH